jgi:shikimate dehydrogenase
MTDVYGIIGYPVGHSLSPAMHNRAFQTLGMDAMYVPFAVTPDRLEHGVRGIHGLELRGVNVTLPHKSTIMPLLDQIEPDARVIGAVNTVVRVGPKLHGTNTDAQGLVRSLEEALVPLRGARVTLLGAGGSARAAVVGIARAGAAKITVCARRKSEADALVSSLAASSAPTLLEACEWHDARTAFATTDLLVQATNATLVNSETPPIAEAFAAALPLTALPESAFVIDLVYRPLETSVLRAAKAIGRRTVDGLGMLLHQGAMAFELWTGRAPPLREMRAALMENL